MTLLDPYLLETLTERCCERPVAITDGVVRFDVREGDTTERWYITMKKGLLTVALEGGDADCVVAGERATFEAVLSGRANAMAALLRGALEVHGKMVLLTTLQRTFPGSPGAEGLPTAGYAERQS